MTDPDPAELNVTNLACSLRAIGHGGSEIPLPLTPLIGRQADVERVVSLAQQDTVRLVTLTGPGGVGKTRITLEVARRIGEECAWNVGFVPLSSLRDSYRVPAAIAQALGIRGYRSTSALDVIVEAIRNCSLLLVLDNFEHLIDAAPFVVRLLEESPQLKVLITSRSVLHVSGEHDIVVAPLEVPGQSIVPDRDVMSYPAVALFIERARAANAGFALDELSLTSIASICRRLDGLPLAIELAAARTAYLSPEAILARLDHRLPMLTGGNRDRLPHQQTMRDTIAWSHDLLCEKEKETFRRLAVFPGEFGLDGATCIATQPEPCIRSDITGSIDEIAMLDVLASLVDKSLIARTSQSSSDTTFSMLQTVREFGLAELNQSGEATETRWRHAQWMARVVEQGEHRFISPEDPAWMVYLLSDLEGISSAAEFAIESGDAQTALRITGGLWGLWSFGGLLNDGRRLIEGALSIAEPNDRSADVARALLTLGMVEWIAGKSDAAEDALQLAKTMAEALDERAMLQHIHLRLSQVALYDGRPEDAIRQANIAIELDRSSLPTVWTATARSQLGLSQMRLGNLDLARTLLEQAESDHQAAGYETGRLWTIQLLADLAFERGDILEAAMRHRESLPLALKIPNAWTIYEELVAIAHLAAIENMQEEATILFSSAARLRQQYGVLPRSETEHPALEPPSVSIGDEQKVPIDQAIDLALRVVTLISEGNASSALLGSLSTNTLTKREMDVLRLLAQGYSNPDIADALFISRKTVEHHVAAIMAKLDVNSRSAVVARAFRDDLL